MVWRPAFVQQFLTRLPDPRSLRFRAVGASALAAGLLGVLLVLEGMHLDERRCEEVARAQAETLATTAGVWLDGDAHVGLGPDPTKRLEDLGATLQKLLASTDGPWLVRTLRAKPDVKAALEAQPDTTRAGALEVVLQTGKNAVRKDVDYTQDLRDVFFEAKPRSLLAGGRVSAYAPVPDSWGATPAIVWVEGPAGGSLVRRALVATGFGLLAGILVSFVVWFARRAVMRLEADVAALDSTLNQLASGRIPGPVALPPSAPSELCGLAERLERVRARIEAEVTGQPLPSGPAEPAEDARRDLLGEAGDFDLALLLQQLIDPARANARARGVELQLIFPDGVPSQLDGHPMALYRAIEALFGNALRTTRHGRVSVRVSRIEGAEPLRLRFEVADTSAGVAFKDQPDLLARLAQAAQADPSTLKNPLDLASAIARALGGELAFESQPGQGTRFSFTAAFPGAAPAPATAFQPRAALPSPIHSSQPRPEPPAKRRHPIRSR